MEAFGGGRQRARGTGEDGLTHYTVTGGGGCKLHVVETGRRKGPAILFIHGFSQNILTWDAQLNSELGERYRLVAFDLRGHGKSDRPATGYDDSKLWADDVNAVITELKLDQPVLSMWSYGPIMLDYVRHYGEEHIGGLHFVSTITKLGSDAAISVLTPELLALVPGLLSTDAAQSVAALESFVQLCVGRPLAAAALYTILGFNASVPPHVRQGMFGRAVDNDALMATIRKPVLITHGTADAVVKPIVVEQHRALMPHAQIHLMPGIGHSPFLEDPDAFNRRLAVFVNAIARGEARAGGGAS